ncbi:hypothetical protein EVAR_59753_1 [Eumeta japonica]|uniref:Uncharacterized protein n=1 Tax=Eumeta variegata TaxID=151549 RepID=A0A4C1ZSF2_EUMVA|nr:hypothetical protein EVAR_59753_1 [Eumeta japonica]
MTAARARAEALASQLQTGISLSPARVKVVSLRRLLAILSVLCPLCRVACNGNGMDNVANNPNLVPAFNSGLGTVPDFDPVHAFDSKSNLTFVFDLCPIPNFELNLGSRFRSPSRFQCQLHYRPRFRIRIHGKDQCQSKIWIILLKDTAAFS